MKIKINKDGVLEIERAGKFKKQSCRFSGFYTIGNQSHLKTQLEVCDDTCPLFGEPQFCNEPNDLLKEDSGKPPTKKVCLNLCKTNWNCDAKDFTDERINQ